MRVPFGGITPHRKKQHCYVVGLGRGESERVVVCSIPALLHSDSMNFAFRIICGGPTRSSIQFFHSYSSHLVPYSTHLLLLCRAESAATPPGHLPYPLRWP